MDGVPDILHFCTYFDSKYLSRGLVLHASLRQHCTRPFVLWVLCFDEETHRTLRRLDLDDVRLITQDEFEAHERDLAAVKHARSRTEYYWTSTPCLPLYVMDKCDEAFWVTYLDADMAFYADPSFLYEEMKEQSVLIVGHRFSPQHVEHELLHGTYNVGFMAFRRDVRSRECLQWWKARCLEWCFDREEDNKFGDQKYLDDWPTRFKNVGVLTHAGVGVGPWNVESCVVSRTLGRWRINGYPLIFFHYHGVAQLSSRWCRACPITYPSAPARALELYCDYARRLLEVAPRDKPAHGNGACLRYQLSEIVRGLSDHIVVWAPSATGTRVLWAVLGLRKAAGRSLHEAKAACARGNRRDARRRLIRAVCMWPPFAVDRRALSIAFKLVTRSPPGPPGRNR